MIKLLPLILKEQFLNPEEKAQWAAAGDKAKKAGKKAGASIFNKLKNAWFKMSGSGAGKTDEERTQDWDAIKNKINAFFTEFTIKPDEKEFQKWINQNIYNLTPQNATKLLAAKYIGGPKQIELSKNILKNLGDEFEFFVNMDTEQYSKIMKRSLGVARGSEQKLREYFSKLVNENLDSLLGETEDDVSVVTTKASKAIGIPVKDIGKKMGNTEMIAQMMTTYDDLFSKIPKVVKQKFIKSIQEVDLETAARALLELVVKNIKFIGKEKVRGKNPLAANVKILTQILGLPKEEITNVLSKALGEIGEQEPERKNALTTAKEVQNKIVNDIIKNFPKWKQDRKNIERIVDETLEDYNVDDLTDEDKQAIFSAVIQEMGASETTQ